MMKEFEFTLEEPITYHTKGQEETASHLTIKAPSNKQRKPVAKMKQGFFRALNSLRDDLGNEKTKDKSNESIKGEEIVALLMMSDIDYDMYLDQFEKLMTGGACLVEDKEQMSSSIFEKMTCNDTERLLGEYLANFLIGSWVN